jgi:large subunit ribosomal protein L24
MKLRTDDPVVVISGKDRGKTGRHRARRPRQGAGLRRGPATSSSATSARAGPPEHAVGVIEKEGPIHVSNVALADPKDGRPRASASAATDGRRMRVTKRSGTEVD